MVFNMLFFYCYFKSYVGIQLILFGDLLNFRKSQDYVKVYKIKSEVCLSFWKLKVDIDVCGFDLEGKKKILFFLIFF